MIIKIIALGFILGQTAYLSDPWNKLDFFIVITGLISWGSGADSFSIFRVFRILRPLRLLTNMQGMRSLVIGFFESIPLLLNTLALLFFIFLMWGLFGLNMFGGGRFQWFCQHQSVANLYRYDDFNDCNERFNYLKDAALPDSKYGQVTFDRCIDDGNGTYFSVSKDVDGPNGEFYVTYSKHNDPTCFANTIVWQNRCRLNWCCPGSGGLDSHNLYIGGEYGSTQSDWHFTLKMPVCSGKSDSETCDETEECVNTGHSAYLNFVRFDNLPIAILVIFQVLTLEDWARIFEATLPVTPYDTFQKWWELIFIYSFYISLVFFGSFFVLNLTIVAIKAKLFPKENSVRKSFSGGVLRKSVYHRERETSFTRSVNELIRKEWFNRIFMVLIILNTIVLGSYHYGMSDWWEKILDYTNYVLTILFMVEMIIKMIGLSVMGYLDETFNRFDGAVAIFAFVEMIILLCIDSAEGLGLSAFRLLRLFRLFRVVRVVKLVRYFETLQRIIWVIACSLESILNIAMLLFLFIFSFALMGMTLFGQSLEEPYPTNTETKTDRTTFENFLSAWIAVFQVLTLEGWVDVMRNTVRQTSWWSCIYFIAWIVIGVYCLLNMFLAIVLQNFEQDQKRQLEKRLEEKRNQQPNHADLSPRMLKRNNLSAVLSMPSENVIVDLEGTYQWRLFCACRKKLELEPPIIKEIQKDARIEEEKPKVKAHSMLMMEPDEPGPIKPAIPKPKVSVGKLKLKPILGLQKIKKAVKSDAFKCMKKFDEFDRKATFAAAADILVDQHDLNNVDHMKEVIVVPEDHILTQYAFYEPLVKFVFGKVFQTFIAFLIASSTIALALDDKGASPELKDVLKKLDITFFTFFLFEAVLKITVMGFMGRPDAYLSDSWNVLDFFVVLTSLFSFMNTSGSLFSAFRALRAFRPLRLLSRYEGMRVVTKALFRSLPAMINVVAVTLLVWLIFAICGVELLNGRMSNCYKADGIAYSDFTVDDYTQYALENNFTVAEGEAFSACSQCDSGSRNCANDMIGLPTDEDVCKWVGMKNPVIGAKWKPPSLNFDDVPHAMLTLFVVSTLEGWVDIMWTAVDSSSVLNCQPIINENKYMALYFMIFIIIGSFFFVSLFVGVVFDNFVKLRDEEMGLGLLTDVQKNWVQTQMMVLKAKPLTIPQPPSAAVKKISPSNSEERRSRKKSDNWRMPFYRMTLNSTFEKVIMVCIVLNVMVMCFDSYPPPEQKWKEDFLFWIDIFFTIIFTIEMIIKLVGLGPWQYMSDNWNKFDAIIIIGAWISVGLENKAENLSMLPMLRILRLFRVSRLIRLVKSMQRLKMLLRTLIISLPSLANVGTLLILMYSVSAIFFMNILDDIEPGHCITEFTNFKTFGRAISTLFVVSTGDNWQQCMEEACQSFVIPGLCSICFVMFYVIVTFITLNLFIAIIIDNFAIVAVEDNNEEHEDVKLTEEMVANFSDAWAILDPSATKFILHTEFLDLLKLVEPPLGVGKDGARIEIIKLMNKVNIPIHDNARIHYGEVLFALADYHCGAKLPSDTKIYKKLLVQLTRKLPKFGEEDRVELSTMVAVVKCQRLWRAKTLKRRLARVKMKFTCKEQQREHVKKELDAIFATGGSVKNEPMGLIKPESSKPPNSPMSVNGWFENSTDQQTGKIVEKGEYSPCVKGTREGEVEGEILELQHLNNNIQQLHSNQQQPSQIIINAPIHIHHYAHEPHPPGTYKYAKISPVDSRSH